MNAESEAAKIETPEATVAEAERPTSEQVQRLTHLMMPPSDKFLEHMTALKDECEKAGEMTAERAALFDKYAAELRVAEPEYTSAVVKFVSEQFTAAEVETLVSFFSGPAHAVVEKALGFSPVVNNIGTAWATRVLERLPDVWGMIMDNVGLWQRKNQPAGIDLHVASTPPSESSWKRVDQFEGSQQAEEFVPAAPEEAAEIEKLRAG